MAAVAIQPAMPRTVASSPVVIAQARPQHSQQATDKENILLLKPTTGTVAVSSLSNIRPRRERPCDACRRRKSRCVVNPGASLCVLCEFHKQSCTFLQDPQPRKRKVPVAEDTKEAGPKKRSLASSGLPSSKQQYSQVSSKGSQIASKTNKSSNNTVVETKILRETLGLQAHRHSRHLGPSSPFDPLLIGLSMFDSRNESILSLGTLRKVNENETFIMQADASTRDHAGDAEALDIIDSIVKPHGPALLDIYFHIIHPSFPVLQKQVFLERVRNGDRNLSPALLSGVYLLALNWWKYDERLSKLQRPDISRLDSIASKSLASTMQRPKLSTVQAGLLLLQRPEADSWSLTTQLVAVGQELGLHLDCTDWQIPAWERSLRKRIAWALYMQDKWSSLIHGRPSHIFAANWAVRRISQDDIALDNFVNPNMQAETDRDKEELEGGHALFTQMIALTGIMAEVMDTFYTQAAIKDFAKAGSKSTEMILDRAKPVQIKLKHWFANLPQSLRMDEIQRGRLSANGFLHLAYFATEITLHRRIVQSIKDDSKPYLVYICRSAAKTRLISAMDFVNRLRPEHLQSFWYFPSKINFTLIGTFGGLLQATAPAREEADFYKIRLREYRWTLSVSSTRAEFLDYAVQMLDASRVMLRNLAEKPSLAQGHISSTGVPDDTVAKKGKSSPKSRNDSPEDTIMSETPPLTRTTSVSNTSISVFSGFSTDALDQYSTSPKGQSSSGFTTPISSA